jgi:hypothetical protein
MNLAIFTLNVKIK